MNDLYTTAINTQKATVEWMDVLADNLTNVYTPGFRENKVTFKTFLGGAIIDNHVKNIGQGKSTPGTSNENLFFEGSGYFMLRSPDGNVQYTRLGEFTFDSEGVYKAASGATVQGYILNDKGEIMSGTRSIGADLYEETALKGGALSIPTTNIKLWIDPNNGKFLGKYDEYEIKNDGTIYGKADGGNRSVPLYKIATANFHNPNGFPKFSILDPTVVYSLPKKQISNGIVDTYAHTLEQYLTTCLDTKVMDRWAEALLLTLIEEAPELMNAESHPGYDSCANFMLTATMGLNGFIAMGVEQDWATHMIGHELTALCGLDHGETLAIVYPGLMDVMRKEKHGKLLQYARRVWNIDEKDEEKAIDMAIEKTEGFFRSIGKKTRLNEYGIGQNVIEEIVRRFTERSWRLGENGIVTPEKARMILERVK